MQEPLAGTVFVHYIPGDGVRLVFQPPLTEKDGLTQGDTVGVELNKQRVWSATGALPVSSWLQSNTRFTIAPQPAVLLHIHFNGHAGDTSFELLFDGLSQQPLKYLQVLVAGRAHLLPDDIDGVSSKGAQLHTRFDVAHLKDGDAILVALKPNTRPVVLHAPSPLTAFQPTSLFSPNLPASRMQPHLAPAVSDVVVKLESPTSSSSTPPLLSPLTSSRHSSDDDDSADSIPFSKRVTLRSSPLDHTVNAGMQRSTPGSWC